MKENQTIRNALSCAENWPNTPKAVWLPRFHWTEVIIENYLNAKAMCELMAKEMEASQPHVMRKVAVTDDLDRAFRGCALAFYGFANTAINAARQLSENITRNTKSDAGAKKLYEYRNKNRKLAKEIADIRNEVFSHPENPQNASYLSSWSTSCRLTATVRPLTYEIGEKKIYKLDPKKHLGWLHEYLNDIFPLLDKCLGI